MAMFKALTPQGGTHVPSPPGKRNQLFVSTDLPGKTNHPLLSPSLSITRARLQKQQKKYYQRSGLFPVRFTGSFHDFMMISIESVAHDSCFNPNSDSALQTAIDEPKYRGNQQSGSQPSMLCFNASSVNIWLKRFHDHWLRLLDFVSLSIANSRRYEQNDDSNHARPGHQPGGAGAMFSMYGEPAKLSQNHRDTMIELLLDLFEKDVYPLKADEKIQQQSLDYVQRTANKINTYLAQSINELHYSP